MQEPSAHTKVYVRGDGPIYHADPQCTALAALNSDDAIGTCRADHAYQSCLNPCPSCGRELADSLKVTLGTVPSGERKRRSRPKLQPLPIAASTSTSHLRITTGRDYDPGQVTVPYGAPSSAHDLRFDNASRVGWGAAAYGQNHEEFLGERTDDDNDWRGGNNYLD
ncbi:hypothetical protein [Actinotalea solisilvae]|uniref:hypothetical protein n=1 Tax=Actinotalea solisilvae TaxID=2072922 RepID=UPI0018F15CA2|nr:hypothetical protein [Actinotalea solisilvae]